MIEIIILVSSVVTAYCVGNVMGWTSGRAHGRKEVEEYLHDHFHALRSLKSQVITPRHTYESMGKNLSQSRRELIDDISRNSFAWSEKDQTFVKVYDAEIIEFPGESKR